MPGQDGRVRATGATDAEAAVTTGPYWSREAASLFAELGSGMQGLSSAEAARRLQAGGPNAIAEEPANGMAHLALGQFKSPLVLILVFGGVVSAILRDWLDAAIILAVVLGSYVAATEFANRRFYALPRRARQVPARARRRRSRR